MGEPQKTPAVPAKRMRVGLNYPWGFDKYGWYFGPHWREGEPPRELEMSNWLIAFNDNLGKWRSTLNVDLVRIFLLCNLINLGNAPDGKWKLPPTLHPMFTEHFTKMLQIARDNKVQLIPSLVDFGIGDPNNGARDEGRHSILTSNRAAFYDLTLKPFLTISEQFRDVIYAWEVMNEPSWLESHMWTTGKPLFFSAANQAEIVQFLVDGLILIRNHRFPSTIGNRLDRDNSRYPTGTILQFHFYAKITDPAIIPPHAVDAEGRITIVGEFSAKDDGEGNPWPWLNGADTGSNRARVRERLLELERLGYPVALVWPEPQPYNMLPPVSDPRIGTDTTSGIADYWAAVPKKK